MMLHRREFLKIGIDLFALSTLGCAHSWDRTLKHDQVAGKNVLIATHDFTGGSVIYRCDHNWDPVSSLDLDVNGLAGITSGFGRNAALRYLPVTGGSENPDNRLLKYDTKTAMYGYITCEYEPYDAIVFSKAIYVLHSATNSAQGSLLLKIDLQSESPMKRILLAGVPSRVSASNNHLYVITDRLITPPNGTQTIYEINTECELQRTFINPYSSTCSDVMTTERELVLANQQPMLGHGISSTLVTLSLSGGHFTPHQSIQRSLAQLHKFKNRIYALSEDGTAYVLRDHSNTKQLHRLSSGVYRSFVANNHLHILENHSGKIGVFELPDFRKIAERQITLPDQVGSSAIFPAND